MTDKATDAKPADKPKAAAADKTDKKATKGKAAKGGKPEAKQSKMQAFKGKFINAFKRKPKDPKKQKAKKEKAKKKKEEKPKVPYIDEPTKREQPSIYIHKVVKLDNKNSHFTEKQFQGIHELSKPSNVLQSFHRIGMNVNSTNINKIPRDPVDKVCVVLINNYQGESDSLGVGPVNDAYLFSMIHHKLGYKIVFLYNADKLTFIKTIEFFLTHTVSALTIYYSGRDSTSRITRTSHGIQFNGDDISLSSTEFGKIVGEKSNGQCKVVIIADCGSGGSVFSMKAATKTENANCSPIISFSTDKKLLDPKERRKTQGLFTYYFCKLLRQFPNSTPNEMADMLNISFERFAITFNPLTSIDELADQPIFPDANAVFNGGAAPAQAGVPKQTTEAIPAGN